MGTTDLLGSIIHDNIANSAVRIALQQMHDIFRYYEEAKPSIRIIEDLLSG